MKRLFLLLICTLGLIACETRIQTSTPTNDARKISAKFQSAKTPKEIDEAVVLLNKYQAAYEEEVYEGKRNIEDLKELLTALDY